MQALQQKIAELLTTCPCRSGLVIINQSTGERLDLNPALVFPAASLIKIPIMYEIMRQSAAGKISLDESLKVNGAALTGGAGILKELRPGIVLTIRELVALMILLSDNTATNLLIDLVGMSAINGTSADLGLKSTVLRRKMMDFAAVRSGRENTTSAADMALMLAAIHSGTGLPQADGLLMLDIMARQQFRDKLPFYLPAATVLANKPGSLPSVEHDAGLLFLPDSSFIICVLTDGLAANYQGIQLIAALGKSIYKHFCLPKP